MSPEEHLKYSQQQFVPETQYIMPQQQGQQMMVMPNGQQVVIVQNPQQNGLINASYICSGIGLLIMGIILGPIGFVLGLIAFNNGDKRGTGAMIFGGIVTVLSIIIAIFIFQSATI